MSFIIIFKIFHLINMIIIKFYKCHKLYINLFLQLYDQQRKKYKLKSILIVRQVNIEKCSGHNTSKRKKKNIENGGWNIHDGGKIAY